MDAEKRLEVVARATALVDDALAELDVADVRNGRIIGALMRARSECSTHEHELEHIVNRRSERNPQCPLSTSW